MNCLIVSHNSFLLILAVLKPTLYGWPFITSKLSIENKKAPTTSLIWMKLRLKCDSNNTIYFSLNALYVKSFTNKSNLILEDIPNTVANLSVTALPLCNNASSALTLVTPYNEIGFNGVSSVQ